MSGIYSALAAVLLICGCSTQQRSSPFETNGSGDAGGTQGTDADTDSGAGTASMSAEDSTSSPETSADETGNNSLKLDVGAGDDETGSMDTGCSAVDILFVIDNSGSMCSHQSSLAQSLPEFADAIFTALPLGTSLHLGITTSSFSSGGTHSEQDCASVQGASEINDAYTTPDIVEVAGNGYQGRLLEYESKRYFEADTSDPATRLPMMQWFANAAFSVNCNGGAFEFPSAAAAYAVDPINEATNAGFLRDQGAVLAIFILSDEVDQSPEGLDTYRDMILAAKAGCGGEQCVSTAGLLNSGCVPSDPFVWQFLNAFGEAPAWGEINDADAYETVVRDSLTAAIEQTCELIPAG